MCVSLHAARSHALRYRRVPAHYPRPKVVLCHLNPATCLHTLSRSAPCSKLTKLTFAICNASSSADSSPTQEPSKLQSPLFNNESLSLLRTGLRIAAVRFDSWSGNALALAQLFWTRSLC